MIQYDGDDQKYIKAAYEHNAKQLKAEIERDIRLLEDMILLAKRKDRAISVNVMLPENNKLTYWVDENSTVVEMLEKELESLKKQYNDKYQQRKRGGSSEDNPHRPGKGADHS